MIELERENWVDLLASLAECTAAEKYAHTLMDQAAGASTVIANIIAAEGKKLDTEDSIAAHKIALKLVERMQRACNSLTRAEVEINKVARELDKMVIPKSTT